MKVVVIITAVVSVDGRLGQCTHFKNVEDLTFVAIAAATAAKSDFPPPFLGVPDPPGLGRDELLGSAVPVAILLMLIPFCSPFMVECLLGGGCLFGDPLFCGSRPFVPGPFLIAVEGGSGRGRTAIEGVVIEL